MSASKVHCYVLNGDVSVVTDINGNVTNVVCPYFNRVYNSCKLKLKDQKFIEGVLTRISDRAAGTRMAYCEFSKPW